MAEEDEGAIGADWAMGAEGAEGAMGSEGGLAKDHTFSGFFFGYLPLALNVPSLHALGARMVADQPWHHPGGSRPSAWHHAAHRQGYRGKASLLR